MHDNALAGDFAFSKLIPTLNEFKVSTHRHPRWIRWFWQNAKTWTAKTQAEFDNLARINLAAKLSIRLPDPPHPKHPKPWTPCKHFGGDHECERCQQRETEAGRIYAGAMALAQKLFASSVDDGGVRPFVRKRIHAELIPFTGGKAYLGFEDLENEVWQRIATKIIGFKERLELSAKNGHGLLAWLRPVVHDSVIDHFKHKFAGKRGDNQTVPLDFEPCNQDSPVMPPVKPVRPAGEAPDAEDKDSSYGYGRKETMGRGRMAK